jgi:hypothetical protein
MPTVVEIFAVKRILRMRLFVNEMTGKFPWRCAWREFCGDYPIVERDEVA